MKNQPSSQYYIRSITPFEAEIVVESYKKFNEIIKDLRKIYHEVIINQEHLVMIYEIWIPAYREMLRIKLG